MNQYITSLGQLLFIQLLDAAGRLRLTWPLRALTYRSLFGVIAAAGLRLSEALRLTLGDIDLQAGALYHYDLLWVVVLARRSVSSVSSLPLPRLWRDQSIIAMRVLSPGASDRQCSSWPRTCAVRSSPRTC